MEFSCGGGELGKCCLSCALVNKPRVAAAGKGFLQQGPGEEEEDGQFLERPGRECVTVP